MQINQIKQSPFARTSLLRHQNFNTSSARGSRVDRKYDNYQSIPTNGNYPLNIWNFREDHNSTFAPLLPNRQINQFSSFQKSMMVNGFKSKKQNSNSFSGNTNNKYLRLQNNPFYRKNLLISREQVEEEVERDLNLLSYKYMIDNGERYKRNDYISSNSPTSTPYETNQNMLNISLMNLNIPTQNEPILTHHQSSGRQQHIYSSPQRTPDMLRLESRQQSKDKDKIRIRGQVFYKALVFPVRN